MFLRLAHSFRRPAGIFLAVLLLPFAARAQGSGSVAGTVVSSWNAAPLAGVTVTVRGTTLAATADAGGRFELKNVPAGEQVLRFSKSGYASATVTEVRVLPDQTTTVNGNLRPEFYDLEEYEVTAEEFADQTEKIIFDRQQSGAMVDAIGSEQFSKLGAADAGAIVAKVTGVSIVDGKYAVVRGLSDRYTRTLLNGVEVPSADPYKLSPQLDLFPSAMIDRISVSKTFTPDQPGGTGGGTIDIRTKTFPEKSFFKFTLGTSYNPNSNLKGDFLADPNSSMAQLALPSGPKPLAENLFGLTEVPRPPGPASSRETPTRANQRAAQANEVQGLMNQLGTANFAGVLRSSPLNSGFTASAGATKPVLGHNFGFFGGVNYKRDFLSVENAEIGRYSPEGVAKRFGTEQRGNIKTDYGANVNLGYELWKESLLGFNFMLAHSTDEEARHATFTQFEGKEGDSLERWQLRYTEREILNYQLNGHHPLPFHPDNKFLKPFAESELDWVVSLADTTQNEPDNRFMNYFVSPGGQPSFGDAATPFPQYPSRYFREITENGFNWRLDWTLPLDFMPNESKLKAGYWSSSSDRNFKEQYFSYTGSQGFDVNNPNSYLNNPEYLNYVANHISGIRTNYNFSRYITDSFAHPYTASLDVKAFYLMGDIGIFKWLRLVAGVRMESTDLSVEAGRDGSSKIKQSDLLPAASLILTMVTNVQLRLSYGETLSRPSFRELAPIQNYLPDVGVTATGNSELQMTAIKSYDIRLEWFPNPGDLISGGLFYKQLENPVELIDKTIGVAGEGQITWNNRDSGRVMGAEFEARKSLEFVSRHFKGLTLGVNASYIQSQTEHTQTELDNNPFAEKSRPLYDQSPYIVNLDLNYEHPTSGTSLTLGANFTGERIVLATSLGEDVYEHPPISFDAAISQKFWKHWTIRFAVKNILDPQYLQTLGADSSGPVFQSYHRGRTYALTLTGEF